MVKIMVVPARRLCSALEADDGTVGGLGAMTRRVEFRGAVGGGELPVGPSTCVFWCAVALGALVGGNPLESVSGLFCGRADDTNVGRSREMRPRFSVPAAATDRMESALPPPESLAWFFYRDVWALSALVSPARFERMNT